MWSKGKVWQKKGREVSSLRPGLGLDASRPNKAGSADPAHGNDETNPRLSPFATNENVH